MRGLAVRRRVWWHKSFIQTDMVLDELEEKDRVVYYSLGTLLYQSGDSYQERKEIIIMDWKTHHSQPSHT